MSHWDETPGHPVKDWQYEVENGDTRQSYAEWVSDRIEQAEHEGQVICTECGAFNDPDEDCGSSACIRARGEEDPDGNEDCRTCGEVFNAYGDGADGECPSCADKTDQGEEE